MTYKEYEQEMNKLQEEYSEAMLKKDWEKCDLIQKRMDRITESTTKIADTNLKEMYRDKQH